jgi:predicted Zn finger-like uncharacterized protein
VVIVCPKCKIRLKIDEGKLKEEGSRFKCPKCGTVLFVKKPVPASTKEVDKTKIIVAHSNPAIVNEITSLLNKNGYQTITSPDGIDAMVKTIKEHPFLVIIEVSLPKIYGFEVCKRLKARAETKDTKFILVSSLYDKNRYKREPLSLYNADDYIYDYQLSELLMEKVNALKGAKPEEKKVEVKEQAEKLDLEKIEKKEEQQLRTETEILKTELDEKIERARRLARTIISDIYLYNTPRADRAIRNNSFYTDFASEIKEGMKLYESRIPQDVRERGDFFKETIQDFIKSKKKTL